MGKLVFWDSESPPKRTLWRGQEYLITEIMLNLSENYFEQFYVGLVMQSWTTRTQCKDENPVFVGFS